MPTPVRVLTPEEDRTLRELRLATTIPQRTSDHAHTVRLNAQGWNAPGWNAPALTEIFECCEHPVRATLKRWQTDGLGGVWDALTNPFTPVICSSGMAKLAAARAISVYATEILFGDE